MDFEKELIMGASRLMGRSLHEQNEMDLAAEEEVDECNTEVTEEGLGAEAVVDEEGELPAGVTMDEEDDDDELPADLGDEDDELGAEDELEGEEEEEGEEDVPYAVALKAVQLALDGEAESAEEALLQAKDEVDLDGGEEDELGEPDGDGDADDMEAIETDVEVEGSYAEGFSAYLKHAAKYL